MKIKILKFIIKKNGFYDRERLVLLAEKTLVSIFTCKFYKIFLNKFYKPKKIEIFKLKEQKHFMERISDHLGQINFFSRIKFKFTKKYGK